MNIRKINVTGGSDSYYVTIPKEIIRNLKWKKGQKVVVKQAGDFVMITDWKAKVQEYIVLTSLTDSTYNSLLSSISYIYEQAKENSIKAFNSILLDAYWQIGKIIVEQEQKGLAKAPYGDQLIENLALDLTGEYGKGFSKTNLFNMRQLYIAYPKLQTSGKLSWSHYVLLLMLSDSSLREIYRQQAIKHEWSVRELKNILKERNLIAVKTSQETEITIIPVLPVNRGKPFAYVIAAQQTLHSGKMSVLVDCGLNVKCEVSLKGVANPQPGDIVESKKSKIGYQFKRSKVALTELNTYVAYIEKIIDGDTFSAHIDCGFGIWVYHSVRLLGIDCPELKTTKGKKAKAYVENLFKKVAFVIVKTYGTEKYGRYLSDVFYSENSKDPVQVASEGKLLNQALLDEKLATLYQV